MGKQLVNFVTCGCDSSAPFFVIYKAGRIHAVLVIGLYEATIKNISVSPYPTHNFGSG
jgi:hypothetical protein